MVCFGLVVLVLRGSGVGELVGWWAGGLERR